MSRPRILMSPPDYFEVAYAINPWMRQEAPVDHALALRQWQNLVRALEEQAGAEVVQLPPVAGLPDLVFTANAAFVYGRQAILARYRHVERQGEEPHVEAWLRQAGFEVIKPDPAQAFEGAGDALIYGGDRVFAGYRQRTHIRTHDLIAAHTGLSVLSLELVDSHFYHVDVCICPLARDFMIYYPGAFDEYGLRVIEANVPEDKRILVTNQEARRFACNAVNVGDTVLLNRGSDRLVELLRERAFTVVELDLSEFIKAGGSAKCLTLALPD